MLRILRSICQNPSDPDLRPNLELMLTRQISFDGQLPAKRIFETLYDFVVHHGGDLPSLTHLETLVQRQYKKDSAEFKLTSELQRFQPEVGSSFRDLVDHFLEDQVVTTLKKTFAQASNKLDTERGKKSILEVIQSAAGDVTRELLEARNKVQESDIKTEGDLTDRGEMQEYMKEVQQELNRPIKLGLMTGYMGIDMQTHGFRKGELVMVAGYTGELKSTLCRNILYNMAVNFGLDVIFFTCEVGFQQTRDLFICIHSTHPKWNRPPLEHRRVKARLFTTEEAEFFEKVSLDLTDPQHGRIVCKQPRDRAYRWSEILAITELEDSQTSDGLDAICLDYFEMVDYDGKNREDTAVNLMIKGAKQFALSFRHGEGIVFLAPFQMNNEGYQFAIRKNGEYQLSHLSFHNQSRRAADCVISTYLGPEGSNFRTGNQVKLCNLKNRDNDPFPPMILQTMLQSGRILNSTISMSEEVDASDGATVSHEEVAKESLVNVLQSLA